MSISKGRVDLDGSAVTLHGTINVLHLLQSVAHVAIGVRKVGMDSANNKVQLHKEEGVVSSIT